MNVAAVKAGSSVTLPHVDDVHPRFSCQLELHHYQSLSSHISSTNLFPTWVNGSTSTVQNVFMRLDQYKKQLLSGVLCINMDLQGSFETGPMSADRSSAALLAAEGLTMPSVRLTIPSDADSGEAICSS